MVGPFNKHMYLLNYTQAFCPINFQGDEESLVSVTYMTEKLIKIATLSMM